MQQSSLCRLIDSRFIPNKHQRLNSRDLTPVDFLLVGYFITSLLSTSTANTPTIHLVVEGIDEHSLKMLLTEFSRSFGRKPTNARLELCLNSSRFSGRSGSALTKILQILSHLDLSNSSTFSDSGAHCIFEGLRNNTTLVHLNLSHTSITAITPDTARSLTKMLQVNKSLKHLNLSNYFMHEFTHLQIISCIFEGIEHNTSLCYLDLHMASSFANIHTDTAAENIAQALKSNYSLLTLNIVGWRFLGRNGIHPIFNSLMFNSTLQTLYISNIDSETLSTFKKAREAKNLPPIDIHVVLRSSSHDTHMRSQSPVLFPFRGSSAGCLSPLHDSQRSSRLSCNSPTSSSSYTTGSQGWLSTCMDHYNS